MTRYDTLIIGAGVHGIAVAYEAARRGRSFCLVDRGDLGSGASSSSLKILHGGLRYLQSLDVGRSRESVAARRRLMTLAPHLVRPLRCRLDLARRNAAYGLVFRAGLILNDLLTHDRNRGVPRDLHLPGSAFPCWYDAICEDTERFMVGLLHAASARVDSAVHTYATAGELVREAGGWRVTLVSAVPEGTWRREFQAGAVVRCLGAHRGDGAAGVSMNVVVDPLALTASGEAVALTHPTDGRNVFVVPWRGLTMVGTWDRPYPHDPRAPLRVEPVWVDELLAWLAPVHEELAALGPDRVRLLHAGLLPLESVGGALLGRASVRRGADGTIDVVGVKYTTALGVAAEAMAALDAELTTPPEPPAPEVPLERHAEVLERFAREDPVRAERLDAGGEGYAETLTDTGTGTTGGVTRGAVEHALRREHARTLADVMFRRTGVASAGHPGPALTRAVAGEMQRHLSWSDAEREREIEAFDADWRFAGSVRTAEHSP